MRPITFVVASEVWVLGWILYRTRRKSSWAKGVISTLKALKGTWAELHSKSQFGLRRVLRMEV
jgi:hypothetical protein